jgi:hypothetical protein
MCPALEDKLGLNTSWYLQAAKEPVDQKHPGEHRCEIEIGLHVGPEPFRWDSDIIPILQTEIPDFEEEPQHCRPKEKDGKFSWPFHYEAVVPAPIQEAVEKQ